METTFRTESPEELFNFILKGNADAVAFLMVLFHVLHIWDDMEDGDKPLSRDQVNDMMYLALVVLPRNRFYRDHFVELNAMVDSAISNWHAANRLEETQSMDDKVIAFIARSDYLNVAMTAARIVGGHQWVREVGPLIRRFWHREGFDGYLANLAEQQRAAGIAGAQP